MQWTQWHADEDLCIGTLELHHINGVPGLELELQLVADAEQVYWTWVLPNGEMVVVTPAQA